MAAHTATAMSPAAIPAGTEAFFGYSNRVHAVYTNLICTSSYTCTSNPQPATYRSPAGGYPSDCGSQVGCPLSFTPVAPLLTKAVNQQLSG
jgi:hypothetical protein